MSACTRICCIVDSVLPRCIWNRPAGSSPKRRCGCCRWPMRRHWRRCRSEEHTSELQSLMRISYAVFCLKKKNLRTDDNRQGVKSGQTHDCEEQAHATCTDEQDE